MVKFPEQKSKEVNFAAFDFVERGELFDYLASCGGMNEPISRYYFH